MTGLRCFGALVLALALPTGCTVQRVAAGRPEEVPRPTVSKSRTTPTPAPSATPANTPSSRPPKQVGPYQVGDCLRFVANAYAPISCRSRHQVEITLSGRTPAGARRPDNFPPDDTLVSPKCWPALRTYLGSSDADATRLEPRAIWPTQHQWNAGQRWFACAVLERDPHDNAAAWTGSRAGVLRHGLGAFQRCYNGEPLDDSSRVVPCSGPHLSEAVPGVVQLGSHTDTAPTYETMAHRSVAKCTHNVRVYLGGRHPDVSASSLMPDRKLWVYGVTTAVCYATSKKSVTGPLGRP